MAKQVLMFDDVTVGLLPAGAFAYASYGDGRYVNAAAIKAKFPQAKVLVIDVEANYHVGDCLDIENGDATNAEAAGWFKVREGHTQLTPKPVLYTSASNVDALNKAMTAVGVARNRYFIWSAHYTGTAHICGPGQCQYNQADADATQYTNRAQSKSLDESLVNEYIFAKNGNTGPTNVSRGNALIAQGLDWYAKAPKSRTAVKSNAQIIKNSLSRMPKR